MFPKLRNHSFVVVLSDIWKKDVLSSLLAELETRLQPVQGLLDALNQEDHDPR